MRKREVIAAMLGATALSGPMSSGRAQQAYPSRPIRLVVASTPGALTDAFARRFAPRLQAQLGQPVVVDNRPGAGGSVGTLEVARSAPDGYTLQVGVSSTHAVNPLVMSPATYDPIRDFSIVGLGGVVPMVMLTNPLFPPRTVPDVVTLLRANPARYSYGSNGVGGIAQLTGELFKHTAGGLDLTHVPYRGSGPAITDLIAAARAAVRWVARPRTIVESPSSPSVPPSDG